MELSKNVLCEVYNFINAYLSDALTSTEINKIYTNNHLDKIRSLNALVLSCFLKDK